jgi:hypothetical protein
MKGCGFLVALTAGVMLNLSVSAATRYVNVNCASPVFPYAGWSTAATNIQDAVDASTDGDLIWVTNGVYAFGGREAYGSNRVAVTSTATVRSVNGPGATVIMGVTNGFNVRCAFLTNGAALIGFTLTNGSSAGVYSGGGVLSSSGSATISNCVIIGNSSLTGGGAADGTLVNCVITRNFSNNGGGAFASTMYNCLVSSNTAGNGGGCYSGGANNCQFIGNSAGNGGGGYNSGFQNCLLTGNLATGPFGGGAAYQSSLINCTVVGNRCTSFSGGFVGGALNCGASINCILYNNTSLSHAATPNYSGGFQNNCCTTPLPAGGSGNFTFDPLLVDPANGDFHLQANSPCINAGNSSSSPGVDLDGNARVAGGTIDVGAYEFQSPVSRISYAWLKQYGLPINSETDSSDADSDGMNNWQEWIAGTDPTNGLSVLKFVAITANNPPGVILNWQSVNNRTYYLERAGSLAVQPSFSSIQSNITGQAGTTSYTDTNSTSAGPFFYRVGVQ